MAVQPKPIESTSTKIVQAIPNLQHLTQVKCATMLWSNYKFRSNDESLEFVAWIRIENEICKDVDTLQLTHDLKQSMKEYIKYIRCEISAFYSLVFSGTLFYISKKVLNKFVRQIRWKSFGRINMEKTGEILINLQEINDYSKYYIACFFCLPCVDRYLNQTSHCNQKLVSEISKHKTEYGNEHSSLLNIYAHNYLIDSSEMTSHVKREIFEGTLDIGEEMAPKYFWSKLDEGDKQAVIANAIDMVSIDTVTDFASIEIIVFLLSKARDDQIVEILLSLVRRGFYAVLASHWLYSKLYLRNFVSLVDNFLSNEEFAEIICSIIESIRDFYSDYWIKEYVEELWIKASYERKRFIIEEEEPYIRLLYWTVTNQNLYLAQLFLGEASIEERQRVLNSVLDEFEGVCSEKQFIKFLKQKFMLAEQEMF